MQKQTSMFSNKITLYNGDCLEEMKNIPDGSVDMVLTDPPYGISANTDYSRFSGGKAKQGKFNRIIDDDKPFDPSHIISKAKIVVLFGANNFSDKLPQGSLLVWDKRYKQKPLMTSDAEVAWCSKGHGVYIFNHYWDGFMKESERGIKRVHPTQKPVALMEWIINKYTKKGDTILDPYMGSGTTGVACMNTGRDFIGIELDKDYFEIARNRIEGCR